MTLTFMPNDRERNAQRLRAIARQAMLARGLLPGYSPAVIVETRAAVAAPAVPGGPVKDLRGWLWCSIDNDDSRDLDQLTVAQELTDGAVRILVAVADVDATVHPGSAIDGHAATNTTSVYTAAQVFPMLPERLSTNLTSLNENEDRRAIVVDMTVAADGVVSASEIYQAAVCNHAKLAYNPVAAWLDGGSMPARVAEVQGMDQQLRIQDRVAQAMDGRRHQHGALSLETLEARAVLEAGTLTDLELAESNRATQLIENFMIAANAVTAVFLERRGYPSLRRVLRSPERWERIVALAAGLGTRLPPVPDARALEAFLCERRKAKPERFPDLSLTVVKLLGRGEYAMRPAGAPGAGHFALAISDYNHSTAPNRRYPDLITQRLLKSALAHEPMPYSEAQLEELAQHCTTQEDNAAKVERRVRKSAAALLLEHRIGELFDAIVTGATDQGTWVRISRPLIEGKLVAGQRGLDVGDAVRVRLTHTDVERGYIDFSRA
jgi:exoribonuclease-2